MARYPSVDIIESVCNVDRATAIKVRRILDGRDDAAETDAGVKRIAECYNRPDDVDLILTAVDALLNTCGVEGIQDHSAFVSRYYFDVVALYCNSGDTYSGTILFDTERETFYATTWGDWVETAERNGRYRFQ